MDLAASAPVLGFAARGATELEVWVGNAGATPVLITLHGARRMALLDAASFASGAHAPEHMDWLSPFDGAIKLDGFALTRILTET